MNQALQHLAIIPDGNRRWARSFWVRLKAKLHRQNITYGHQQGTENLGPILKELLYLGIPYVTIWACSPSNLQRSPEEVELLYKVLKDAFERLLQNEEIHRYKVNIKVVGRWRDPKLCPLELQDVISKCILATRNYNNFTLTILVAYSGLDEIVDTIRNFARSTLLAPQIDYAQVIKRSWNYHLPPVDLVIRTGVEGDPHNSEAFLPFHTANSQYYFARTYWPAFSVKELRKAIKDFYHRERRFGK